MAKKEKTKIMPQPAKEEEPDRLTQEATEALAAGMSYGKYKARQYTAAHGKIYIPKQEKPDPLLKYELTCQVCSTCFRSKSPSRKYCSTKCKDYAYRMNKKKKKTSGAEIEQAEDLPLGGFHDY